MQPEWSGDPEVKPVFLAVTLTGMVAFLLMVWLFAFYWWWWSQRCAWNPVRGAGAILFLPNLCFLVQ